MLLQAFYLIRLTGAPDLLFRWFVGIGIDDAAWDHSVFSKNRDRLLEGDISAKFLSAILSQPKVRRLLSTDHFSVDGTLIEAWAAMKPKDGSGAPPTGRGGRNAEADFHFDDRPGRPALQERQRQGDEAVFHGAWPDGESAWPTGRCLPDRGTRPRRKDCGAA